MTGTASGPRPIPAMSARKPSTYTTPAAAPSARVDGAGAAVIPPAMKKEIAEATR